MPADLNRATDEELASATQAGSLSAFEELARRYERRVFAFLGQRLADRRDTEDLTQQTFIAAYRKIHLYRREFRFAPWLFTIARHLRASHYRTAARGPAPAPAAAAPAPAVELDERSPAAALVQHETKRGLWDLARDLLSPDQFAALWLRYAEDLKVEEIARTLGHSPANVKVLLHRGRRTLAGRLEPDGQPLPAATFTGRN